MNLDDVLEVVKQYARGETNILVVRETLEDFEAYVTGQFIGDGW